MATADENLVNARRALDADAAAPVGALHKFPQWLFDGLDGEADGLRAALQAIEHVEGDRQEDETALQAAYGRGEALIRDINRYLNGLLGQDVPAIKTRYGLQDGVLTISRARLETLLLGFASATAPAGATLPLCSLRLRSISPDP